jgi:spermidine synthase
MYLRVYNMALYNIFEKEDEYQASTFREETIKEFGVEHNWHNVKMLDSLITRRDTHVQMIERPGWGIACYMDNSIQSCEVDERIYHEALVHPVMASVKTRQRVMIIGGGEGATAREVLKWPDVEHVDMYEWDEDVVELFKTCYPQWAKGAWDDPRLSLRHVDIFESIKQHPHTANKYDVIIIDLFDPTEENLPLWTILLKNLHGWITTEGSIVMYAGMRNILTPKQPHQILAEVLSEHYQVTKGFVFYDYTLNKNMTPYRVYIPSFSGESSFLLLTKNTVPLIDFEQLIMQRSHITPSIWTSYKTMNW